MGKVGLFIFPQHIGLCIYVYMYVCIYAYMYIYRCIDLYRCIYICRSQTSCAQHDQCEYIFVHSTKRPIHVTLGLFPGFFIPITQTYMHSNTYIHTCIHTYIRTYIHTYIHTYTHAYRPLLARTDFFMFFFGAHSPSACNRAFLIYLFMYVHRSRDGERDF